MGVIVIGPRDESLPDTFDPPIVWTADEWSANDEDWTLRPEIAFRSASVRTGGAGLGSMTLTRDYGKVVEPFESGNPTKRDPLNLDQNWVRVLFSGANGQEYLYGIVSSDDRNVFGGETLDGSTKVPSGVQTYVVSDLQRYLQKVEIAQSWFEGASFDQRIDWVPGINVRDDDNLLVGNRSVGTSTFEGTYGASHVYSGGPDARIWTHHEYLTYLLERFVKRNSSPLSPGGGGLVGPDWTIGGDAADVLKGMSEPIPLGPVETAHSILKKLIPIRSGIDYWIRPTATGFEINVFSLLIEEQGFGGEVVAKNPSTVRVESSDRHDLDVRITRSSDNRYGKVRVQGERVKSCFTLRGARAPDVEDLPFADARTLERKWTETQETSYKAGDPSAEDGAENEAELHDKARRRDELRQVYSTFGAPDDWDFGVFSFGGAIAVPRVTQFGELKSEAANVLASRQSTIRATLNRLPLREGFDYRTNPETQTADADSEQEFLPPIALVKDEFDDRWLNLESEGWHVHNLKNEWGLFVRNPRFPHRLALDDWAIGTPEPTKFNDDEVGNTAEDVEDRAFDYDTMVATIAIETDLRIALEYSTADTENTTTKVITVPGAEAWWVAPNTVIGTNEFGQLLTIPESAGRTLRNDVDRLRIAMAGAIARYFQPRSRAVVSQRDFVAPSAVLGSILTVVDEGEGATQEVKSAITSIDYDGDDPKTTFRSGYA